MNEKTITLAEEHIWNQDLVSIDREKRWGRQADTFERQVDGLLDFIERQPNPTAAAYYYVNGGRPFSIPEGNELLDIRSINALWETTAKKAVATLAAYVHYYKEGKPLYQRTHGLINEVNVTPEILRDYGDRLRKMAARLGMKFRIEDSKHFIRRVAQRRLPEEYVHRMIETVSKQAVASRMCQKRLDEGRSFDFLIADKQTCIVVKVYLLQDGDTLVANIATAFVYDGKAGNLAYDGRQYIYYLNDDNPSKEWEEAEVTAEWYGNETWSQGGTGDMEKFISRNFDKEGNPLSYKAWVVSNDNLKNNVKGEVRKKVNREQKKKGEEENNNNKTNKDMQKINENQLRQIIAESVKQVLNEEFAGNSKMNNVDYDGRYHYQGTGSPESEDRVRKIEGRHKGDYYSTRHGESMLNKKTKEYGRMEYAPMDEIGYETYPRMVYIYMRDYAGGRMSWKDFKDSVELFLNSPKKAAEFIKYLHMNGFKTRKLSI